MTDAPTQLPQVYEEDEISLLDILVTLAESWKLLVFGPLLAGVLAGALSFLWPNTYESVAIARLAEEEAVLFHATPVLDPLIEKFGYLERADGIREDARNALKKDLAYTADKKTKLVTLAAKGRTPEQAQAMGRAAFEALFAELVPKGKEKEAILQEIAINNQLIADGVVYVDRSASKQNPANPANPAKGQVANLKLNNLELQLKLQAKGGEVFAQEPSLPQRKSAPKRSLVVVIAVLASGFALLMFVFVRKAWQGASQDPESSEKIAVIKKSLSLRV
jgi:capsular polysaccharide biosynthesis protein